MFVLVFFRFCLGRGSEFGGGRVLELCDVVEEDRGVKVAGRVLGKMALDIGLGVSENVEAGTTVKQVFEEDVVAVEVDKEADDTCVGVGVWLVEDVAIVDGL